MRLPAITRSLRFRLSGMTSAMAFGIGGIALGGLYLALLWRVRSTTMRALVVTGQAVEINGRRFVLPRFTEQEIRTLESVVNEIVLNQAAVITVVALLVLFVLSLLIGWFVAGRALKPLDRITQVAKEIEATDLSRRISLDGADDELSRMADTFDGMLDRLDRAFAAQRRFLAQTSHDLRTPLAVIRTNIDVALGDPEADAEEWRATGEIVSRAAERMSWMIDDLLAAARLEAGGARLRTLDLAEVTCEVGEEVEAKIVAAGRSLRVLPETAMVEGDPASLARAVANLIENALAASPVRSEITLRSGRAGGWGLLAVGDRGPGIDPALVTGEAPRQGGLGLEIVREITRAHGGRVGSVHRREGGSWVVIAIPLSGEGEPSAGPALDRLREL